MEPQKIMINIKNAKFEPGFSIQNGTEKIFIEKKEEVLKYIERQKECDYAEVVVLDETNLFPSI